MHGKTTLPRPADACSGSTIAVSPSPNGRVEFSRQSNLAVIPFGESAQLIQMRDQTPVWIEQYDRDVVCGLPFRNPAELRIYHLLQVCRVAGVEVAIPHIDCADIV